MPHLRHRTVRNPLGLTLTALAALSLAGCADRPQRASGGDTAARLATVLADAQARAPLRGPGPTTVLPDPATATSPADRLLAPEIRRGPRAAAAVAPAVQGPPVTLNFGNTDLREVVDTVLGDILGLNYVVDPRVQGTVTLRSTDPIPRANVLPALESVLTQNGFALVRTADLYRVVPADQATALSGTAVAPRPGNVAGGFGTYVIPLEHAGAARLREVLQPFVPQGRALSADPATNSLVFAGTGAEARTMVELIDTFDVSQLAGKQFALLPVRRADPVAMSEELGAVFDTAQDAGPGAVTILPLERLKAVLVIARSESLVATAQEWVTSLDRGASSGEQRPFVYRVQNGRAAKLAETLGLLFDQDGGRGARRDREDFEVAPGLSEDRLESGFGRGNSGFGGGGAGGLGGNGVGLGGGAQSPAAEGGAEGGNQAAASSGFGRSQAGPSRRREGTTAVRGPGGIRVVGDESTNSLLIYATAEQFETIRAALREIDVIPRQVLIEATIAEVSLTDDLRYGLQWFFNAGSSNLSLSNRADGVVAPTFPGFNYSFAGQDVRVVLSALSEVTDVNVISSPLLMVLNNEPARLQVGDQVPIAVQSSQSVLDPDAPIVSTIQYRDTGVILRVTPRVNENGQILLDVVQEVSDVVPTSTSGLNSPTIQQRQIASSVVVQSGEPLALGGLIRDRAGRGRAGLPILSKIPILGSLFSTTTAEAARTELLVVITPRVVANPVEARILTEELRGRLSSLRQLDERIQTQVDPQPPDPRRPDPQRSPAPTTAPVPLTPPSTDGRPPPP